MDKNEMLEDKEPNSAITLLEKIKDEVLERGTFKIMEEGMAQGVLKGSFIRSYELTLFLQNLSNAEEAFFVAAALRGAVEDIIVLSFFKKLPKKMRDEAMMAKVKLEMAKAAGKQISFFNKYHPYQPTVSFDDTVADEARQELRTIAARSGLWSENIKAGLPPTAQMAGAVDMTDIYDFIYSLTSDVVHFNPRITLRSGWGTMSADEVLETVRFSTRNFGGYYIEFCKFYSLFLFILFCRRFTRELKLSVSFCKTLDELNKRIDNQLRWPEALTFEELNQKPPTSIMRILLKATYNAQSKGKVGK